MVILSVDHGDARTGIAVCDKNEMLAYPVAVISERKDAVLIQKISALADTHCAQEIVIGLPVNMDGTEGERAKAMRSFGEALGEAVGIPVVFRDERLSTVGAHQLLNITDTRGKKRKQTVDAVSAVLILEDYIGYRRLQKARGTEN